VRPEGLCQKKKNSNESIGNRISDLPACSADIDPEDMYKHKDELSKQKRFLYRRILLKCK